MPATASKPFTAVCHELADIEKINGKVFTMNMVYTYALIEGYQTNGQTAYFSQELLSRRLGLTDRSVRNLLREMVEMGLINKTGQIGGKTCHYTVNPITPKWWVQWKRKHRRNSRRRPQRSGKKCRNPTTRRSL